MKWGIHCIYPMNTTFSARGKMFRFMNTVHQVNKLQEEKQITWGGYDMNSIKFKHDKCSL